MVSAGVEKFIIWLTRFLQVAFCALIIGPFAWFLHGTYHKANLKGPYELRVPLILSWLAFGFNVLFCLLICFYHRVAMLFYTIWDSLVAIVYIASAIMYRHNFHVLSRHNPLRNELVNLRVAMGKHGDKHRIGALVHLGAASIIIQIILYSFTAFLCWRASRKEEFGRVRR